MIGLEPLQIQGQTTDEDTVIVTVENTVYWRCHKHSMITKDNGQCGVDLA